VEYRRILFLVSATAGLCSASLAGDGPKPIRPDDFAKWHHLIKPRPGESRWMEIDWHPTVWEGRQKAAAEGKPLLLWAGSGGAPAAGC
jgi:hypothetical protein